jgi:hypothetical protein
MSFDSILGPSHSDPVPPKQIEQPAVKQPSTPSYPTIAKPWSEHQSPPQSRNQVDDPVLINGVNGVNGVRKTLPAVPDSKPVLQSQILAKPRKMLTQAETQKITTALAKLDDATLSDVDTGKFDFERTKYDQRGKKRARDLVQSGQTQRKVSNSTA